MDSGTIITEPLEKLRAAVEVNGFYAPIGYWYFSDWIHPDMLKYSDLTPDWRYDNWTLEAGIAVIDTRRPMARKLLSDWAHFAAIEEFLRLSGVRAHGTN